MKSQLILFILTLTLSSLTFASDNTSFLECSGDEDALQTLTFDHDNMTVTMKNEGKVLCEKVPFLSEGEVVEYGEGLIIFDCNGESYDLINEYDEKILVNEHGNEHFCI